MRQELRARPAFLKYKKVILWEFVERDISLGLEGWKLVALPSSISTTLLDPTNNAVDLKR